MKEKIKNLFNFLGAAWRGGNRGKIGIALALIALFMFVRMFFGTVSIQKFVMNTWRLRHEQEQLVTNQAELDVLQNHIKLIQNYSADYVEELGLKYLNMGDPKTRILKVGA